jgi:hypothetical protein
MPNTRGRTRGVTVQFKGLDHTQGAQDGAIWDMKNLTSKDYPVLSTRFHRMHYGTVLNPQGFGTWDGLFWVSDGQFYYDGLPRGEVTDGKKSFGHLGAFVVILPDKAYYNVLTGDFGNIEAEYDGEAGTFAYNDGFYLGVPADKNALQTTGDPFPFRIGDTISISGNTTIPANNRASITIQGMSTDKKTLYFYDNSFYIPDSTRPFPIAEALTLKRSMPDIDYLTDNNNRLWGCKGDTIYASALGNIFDWTSGTIVSSTGAVNETGSWAAGVGSEGDFTACFAYRGQVLCFKEEIVYQVYGDLPSNFAYQPLATLGVMAGSDKSLAVAGETLFYLSRVGVMAYRGSIPEPITAAFGNERFEDGVAGSDGLKYYISMADRNGNYRLYVYDAQLGMWHIEDETQVYGFAFYAENLYMMSAAGDINLIGDIFNEPDGLPPEPAFPWFCEFGDFIENEPNKKTAPKLLIRCELTPGSTATVWVKYDSAGEWVKRWDWDGTVKQSYYVPLIPTRADYLRLRFEGVGDFRLYSLTREYTVGSGNRSYKI